LVARLGGSLSSTSSPRGSTTAALFPFSTATCANLLPPQFRARIGWRRDETKAGE
jgi:hypothetical protein